MKKKTEKDHKADTKNPNKGTNGTNEAFQKKLDNRANQLNPNNKKHNSLTTENK